MMSIDKQYLREVAKQATGAHERINAISADDIFDISLHHDGAQLDADITDLNSFNEAANHATVLELLDELEAAEKRIAELEAREVVLPQRYSMLHRVDFDEPYHTEMVYRQHQVLEALHDAGVNVAADAKGAAS
ncbi:ead/Ea22-like family protein [Enterobacter cloacae]|uniref:Ead/Ea22-like family protein n=1 Tax=Enterobacter cloacae TaxID=550 RepID=A0AA42UD16_ENTCL|nr:ead/Ea22-like family protein [Enterobacter cloacae]MDH0438106.1 ead/Ea22-like family protein [Enterobacter cloacae]MDH1481342.1 ead/Ea22-like family protein [Enterobacter cloacae]